ncbi:hypothetical protein [Caldifermentibacillus hisashii]|uniref:hypothetical protein n=1 Tax=Caldifermentibacillus hisashii TaxID=996558 RepID=UPI002DFDF912|nr:hypothetical protein [Caldifermentibacillus hisashii]
MYHGKPINRGTRFRRHFGVKNALFWRRDPFSSPFWVGKSSILAARPNLVTFFG